MSAGLWPWLGICGAGQRGKSETMTNGWIVENVPENSVLGINYSGAHDSAIAIVAPDGEPVFACSLERVTRVKQDGRPPVALLDEPLWERVSTVAVSTDAGPWSPLETKSKIHPAPLKSPRDSVLEHGPGFLEFMNSLPRPKRYVCHQLSHAASAFWMSGFTEALCLTYDGGMHNSPWFGGLYTASRESGIKPLDMFAASHYAKITTLYSIVTALLGFTPNKHEGKVTGLAAMGRPTERCRAIMEKLFFDDYYRMEEVVEWFNLYSRQVSPCLVVHDARRKELAERFDGIGREEIAATVQEMAEEHVLKIIENATAKGWAQDSICLAGGLFANVKINQKIKEAGFGNIFIAPPMTDDGTALGAALHVASLNKEFNPPKLRRVFLGHGFGGDDIEESLRKHGLAYRTVDNPAEFVAQKLSEGKVVGVFQGRMEFGPRALGNRSVLSQAVDRGINTTLNEKLNRTEFMPFAPVTRIEDAADLYIGVEGAEHAAEFMTITFSCADEMKRMSPGVVHVDGTARPQLVTPDTNPFIYETLTIYKQKTGIPSVVNTSFNIHEEPIVCSPDDAVSGFLLSGLDYLYLEGGYVVEFGENLGPAVRHLQKILREPSRKERTLEQINLELSRRAEERLNEMVAKEDIITEQAEWIEDFKEHREALISTARRIKLPRLLRTWDNFWETFSVAKHRALRKIGSAVKHTIDRFLKDEDASINVSEGKSAAANASRAPKADLKFSIVTPTYNHAQFIETTIKSVIANNYENLEYIIVDGASTDNTKEIVNKHREHISKFVSEKDEGQSDAINKGFRNATGDILAYINSDDYYFPYTFEKVARVFSENPDIDVVYGDCVFVDKDGQFLRYFTEIEPFNEYRLRTCTDFIMQPSTFFRREAYEKAGGFDIDLKYGFDWDMWCKMARSGMKFYYLREPLAVNREYQATKTSAGGNERLKELYQIVNKHKKGLIPHAIFNYVLSDIYSRSQIWYRPFATLPLRSLAFTLRMFDLGEMLRHQVSIGDRALYGLFPYTRLVKQHAVYYLPWYNGQPREIKLSFCVPWVKKGSQKLKMTLNDRQTTESCICRHNRNLDVTIDCRDIKDNYLKLEIEFSRVFAGRFSAYVTNMRVE